MIAYLKGKLAHKDRAHVIIDVNGVGYEVKISLQTYAALADGEEKQECSDCRRRGWRTLAGG